MLLVPLNQRIHQVASRVSVGVVAEDASVVAGIWDAREESWEGMESYSVEMGKGASHGLMEYVLVSFCAIL